MGLYQDYRPKALKHFVGNDDLKRDLRPFLRGERKPPKAILFTGPSGAGKTTLARILARAIGCAEGDIQELDTADFRGIDSIRDIRRQMSLASLSGQNRVWILDECFARGTPVSTPQGDRPIEAIQVGDQAYSAAGADRVERVFKNRVPLERVCRIACNFGHPLLSSVEHLFFTLRGWVEAKNLRQGEALFKGRFGDESAEASESLRGMWEAIYGSIRAGNLLQQEMQEQKIQYSSDYIRLYMRLLRQAFYEGGGTGQILLARLLSYGTNWQEAIGEFSEEDFREAQGIPADGRGPEAATSSQSAYEGEQSGEQFGLCQEGIANQTGARDGRLSQILPGRQWQAIADASSPIEQAGGSGYAGVCHTFGQAEAKGLSNELQGGPGDSGDLPCDRDRRAWSQFEAGQNQGCQKAGKNQGCQKAGKNQGCQKAGKIGIARVESIEIYQPSCFGRPGWDCIGDKEVAQGFVEFFDLELKKHHSYFADGILVHNCHKLTNDAQNALLKALENPPEHVYFILCTTDPQLLIKTILTRCTQFIVEALSVSELIQVMQRVCQGEGLEVPEDALKSIAKNASGSPRAALSMLERLLARSPEDYEEVLATFSSYETQIKDLCQTLIAGKAKWKQVADLIKNLKEEPETVRRSVLGYMNAILLGGKDAPRAAYILDCFKEPYFNIGPAGLTLSCYAAMLQE